MCINRMDQDFPGGTVDESPPASARDTDLIPAPGRFQMLRSNQACLAQYVINVSYIFILLRLYIL